MGDLRILGFYKLKVGVPFCLTQTLEMKLFLLDYIRAIPVVLYKRCVEPKEKWAVVIVFRKILKLKKKKFLVVFLLYKIIPKRLKFLSIFVKQLEPLNTQHLTVYITFHS